jgi:hypothetical protein
VQGVKQSPVVRAEPGHGADGRLQVAEEKVFDVECDGVLHKGIAYDMLKVESQSKQ